MITALLIVALACILSDILNEKNAGNGSFSIVAIVLDVLAGYVIVKIIGYANGISPCPW